MNDFDFSQLLSDTINSIKLKILVFGPQVEPLSTDVETRELQLKRIQIKDALVDAGHFARFAEDLVVSGLNAMVQEKVMMQNFDLVIVLLGSHGANSEATIIADNPDLAMKAQLFLDSRHVDGFVHEVCKNAEIHGAHFKSYQYPQDLTECHLLGFAKERVSVAQQRAYLL